MLTLKEGDLVRYKGIGGPTMVVIYVWPNSEPPQARLKWFDNGGRMTSEEVAISPLMEVVGNVYDKPLDADLPLEPPAFKEGDTVQFQSLHRTSPIMSVVYPRTPAGVQVTWFDASHRPVFEHYPESLLRRVNY